MRHPWLTLVAVVIVKTTVTVWLALRLAACGPINWDGPNNSPPWPPASGPTWLDAAPHYTTPDGGFR